MTSIQKFVFSTFLSLLANVTAADRTQDPAFVAKVDKLMADTNGNQAQIAEEKTKSAEKLAKAEAENAEKFSEMETVCEDAAQFEYNADNFRGTASQEKDGITIYMGSAAYRLRRRLLTAQDAAMNVILELEKVERIEKVTANHETSIRNCEACKKDPKSSKCAGANESGKKAEGETVVEEKVVDGKTGDGGSSDGQAAAPGGALTYQSHAAQNLMLFGAFASLV